MIWDRPLWYDRRGQPIRKPHVAGRLLSDFDYKVVAKTEVGAYEVSTVWLGLDHGFDPEGPPVIFETMVFVAAREDDVPVAEFVLARIAEDEADQRRNMPDPIVGEIDFQPGAWHRSDCEQNSINAGDCDCDVPSRVLAQCEAMRRIVEEHPIGGDVPGHEWCRCCTDAEGLDDPGWPCPTLLALAAIWSDHPDYDDGWAAL